jgi:hypothetical protein|tara:strand:- start:7159 stop:9039 length:1881 start_codon:yes stop_codon:yes gene_type:complete
MTKRSQNKIQKGTEVEVSSFSSHYDQDFSEKQNRNGWIEYGDSNSYPDFLIELYQNSSIHSALINGISDMIYGEGLNANDKDQKPDQWLRLKSFLQTIDQDEIKKCIKDLKVFGGYYMNVVYSIDRSTFTEILHIPFQDIRSGEQNEDGIVESYFYSKDWQNYRKKENTPEEIKAFNPEEKNLYPNQLLCVSGYSVGDTYYPKPDYLGSINYIELDKEIAIYHLNNIKNGLAPSFMMNFNNGIPPLEKRRKLKQDIKQELQGPTNAGKFVLTFSDGKDRSPDITPFPLSDADKQYQFLSTEVTQKIMIGHRVTSPMLFGIKDQSGLGNNADELRTAFELFEATVVQPFQQIVLKSLNMILKEVGISLDLYFESMKPISIVEKDIPQLDENEISSQENLSGSCCDTDRTDLSVDPIESTDNKYIPDEEEENRALESIKDLGEDQDLFEKDWICIEEEVVDIEPSNDQFYTNKFAFSIESDPDARSYMDSGFYRIRYKYAGPQPISTSRKFCIDMITTNRLRIYRKEDITKMTMSNTNKPFGRYSIFLWKGSYNCRHKWKRLTYFLRRVPRGKTMDVGGKIYKGGQFLPADRMKHFKIVGRGYLDTVGPSLPIVNPTATHVNPKVLND